MNIASLLEPKSIAVVGASTEIGSVGNDIVKNLIEQKFKGEVFPVNPKAGELYGVQCFPNLDSIARDVECAIIAVPANIVPSVLQDAVRKRVRAVAIISAGFGEVGNGELEREVIRIAKEGDIALLGPNCLGIVNPSLSMNASFARTLPKRGHVAFLSQSGALGTAILDAAGNFGIGISKFVSLGNKACLDESTLLEYFANDRKTRVIAIYAESFRNPEALKRIARKMSVSKRPKPIIVLKSGRTTAGASALSSHTGALAGNDASYDALFEEAGILRAETAEELFMLSRVFSLAPLPKGRHIAILTNAGGPGVLAADSAALSGLLLASLSDATKTELTSFLPSAASTKNPVDILGDAKSDRYERAFRAILLDEAVHMALVILTPQSMTDVEKTAEAVSLATQESGKPVVVVFMGGKLVAKGMRILLAKKIPVAHFPEDGIRMLSALMMFSETRRTGVIGTNDDPEIDPIPHEDRERIRALFSLVRESGRSTLSPVETLDFFAFSGFPVPKYGKATTVNEAREIGGRIGGPMALKILSDDITHKSDVGGVFLNVAPEHVGEVFAELMSRVRGRVPSAKLDGVVIMEMASPGGIELIMGSFRDPNMGQTIMVGSGGIYAEILKDTAFSLPPTGKRRAQAMLEKLSLFPILKGARGNAPFAIAAVAECLERLSALLGDFPEVKELDMNPIIVYPNGSEIPVLVVDGRVLLADRTDIP